MLTTTVSVMKVMPNSAPKIAEFIGPLNTAMLKWGIDTNRRIAAFLAEVAAECGELMRMRENLNYHAEALVKVWPNRFWLPVAPEEQRPPGVVNAWDYHRQPQKIANRVYANRLGNGDEASGDGYAYRGGGGIQLTGKANYRNASIAVAGDADTLLLNPELIESPHYAMQTAGWFWQANGLNKFADACDIDGCSTRINGGKHGAEIRRAFYQRACAVYGV